MPLDALLGSVFNSNVRVELGGGLNFASGLQAVYNTSTKRIDVTATGGGGGGGHTVLNRGASITSRATLNFVAALRAADNPGATRTDVDLQLDGGTLSQGTSGLKVADGGISGTQLTNSAVDLTSAKVTGTLPAARGGTGLAALGGALSQLRVNAGGTALEYFSPPAPTIAAPLTNANLTRDVTAGSQHTLPASTLVGSAKSLQLLATGSPELDEIVEVIVYAQAFDYALKNTAGVTIYTVVAGTKRVLHAQWDGAEWQPAGKIRLA